MTHAERIIAACRKRGSNADDLRDASHEASHALECGAEDWEREALHKSLVKHCASLTKSSRNSRMVGAMLWASEMQARAVERIVCKRLGVEVGFPIESGVFTSIREATSFRLPHADFDLSVSTVKSFMTDETSLALTDRIMAL